MEKVIQIADLRKGMCNTPNPIPGRIYLAKGISPALNTCRGNTDVSMDKAEVNPPPPTALRTRSHQPRPRRRLRYEQIPRQQLFQHRHCGANVKPKTMDSRNTIRHYIIGQSHDARGNLANYHVVNMWPCVVAGCSQNRLTRILWIEPKR